MVEGHEEIEEREPREERGAEGERKALSTDRLGTGSILKLLLEFSIPAIIMMTFNALYNIVDSIFLGQAGGEAGIAVTTLAFPIMVILMGLSALAGQGGNALAAIQLGEDRIDAVERTVGNTVLLLIIIAVLIAFAGIVFIDPLLAIVGTCGGGAGDHDVPDSWWGGVCADGGGG